MKQIHNWEELEEVSPSTTHYIEVDIEMGCGRLRSRDNSEYMYLSTHTFYGYGIMPTSKKLQECGFDIELIGWDKEPKKKLAMDYDYRTTQEQIKLISESSRGIEYNSPHFENYSWHDHQREFGISKREKFKAQKIRRKR